MVLSAVMEMTEEHQDVEQDAERAEETGLTFEPVVTSAALARPDLSLLTAVIDCFPGLVTPTTDTPGGPMAVLTSPDQVAMLYHEDWWYRLGAWETTTFALMGKDGPVSRARRARVLAERTDIVQQVLAAAMSRTPYSLDFFLHGPGEQHDRALLRAAAALWHDLRIREGHTPETAFFLLTMTLAPSHARHLSLDPATGRLVLDPDTPQFLPC